MGKERKRKQHYVPRFYLKNFAILKNDEYYTNCFEKSATLKNALFSLSALWYLHYEFDHGYDHSFPSEIFEAADRKDSNDVKRVGCIEYTNKKMQRERENCQ